MMSTKELQIASMMSIFFLGFVFGAVPVLGRRYTSKKRFYTTFMGLANTFAAGIFMSLSVVHLLPEVAKDFQDLEGEERNRFRIPFVMCIAGYVAVLTIERVVFVTPTCAHHMMDAQGGTVPVQAAPADDFTGLFHPEHPKVTECEQSLLQSDALNKIDPISRVRASTLGGTNLRAAHTDGLNESIPVVGSINRSCSVEGTHLVLRNSERVVQVAERIPDNTLVSKHHHGHGHAHEHSQNDVSNLGHSTITPLLLMAALLTHGVSEGLALGVETTRQSVLVLSLALISHKWAEGLALGISFSRSDTTTRRSLLYILVFSLGTPLGICLGMSLSRLNSVVGLYFQAFSCGTFLYIGASEVVVEEFIQGKRNFGKLLTFLIGFGVIYALTITDAG